MQPREELLESYARLYGRRPTDITASVSCNEQAEKYSTHGLAEVVCQLGFYNHILIDVAALRDIKAPKEVWYRGSPNNIRVFVSSGKQSAQPDSIKFDSARILEGIDARFYYDVAPGSWLLYTVDLVPLYK